MKITFLVAHLLSGGAERTVVYLSNYFADSGHDVIVLSLTDDIFYQPGPGVNVRSLHLNEKATGVKKRFQMAVKRYKMVGEFLKQNPTDVVFCMLPDMAKYVLYLKRKLGFRLITSERNNPESVKNKNVLHYKKKIYKKSDGIVFQTQRAMDFYEKDIRQKGVVIHNAVGNPYVYEAPETTQRKPKISAMGRLTDQKDYKTLIRAFQPIAEKYPAYTLEIYGTGPDENKLKTLTKELGLESQVYFCGVCKDAILKVADSACYVMSSKYEGMPNALMEAMAVGLPCISTDCPNGPAELIENGENGLLVPVGDVSALTDAMFTMIERKTFAEKCGKNAKRILETHSIEKNAKAYMDFILKIYDKD